MAIRKDVDYPGRWSAATTGYPMGEPKNRTTSTSKDGSYLEKKWIQDYEAFFGALLNEAGVSPNGSVDTAESSQFFDALQSILLGVNQTWQDVTSSRTAGTTYTNNTGKPIQVSVITTSATDSGISLSVDGSRVAFNDTDSSASLYAFTVSSIIPNGSEYSVSLAGGAISTWMELR